MPSWKKNLFTRVIKTRTKAEGRTKEDLIQEYPALTEEEKQEILSVI